MTGEDLDRLRDLFERYDIDADPAAFAKITRLSEKPFYKAKQIAPPAQVPLAVPQG
jgi:hypothetical protein